MNFDDDDDGDEGFYPCGAVIGNRERSDQSEFSSAESVYFCSGERSPPPDVRAGGLCRKQEEQRKKKVAEHEIVTLCETSPCYALCEASLTFSETACMSVNALGEMSATDTAVPTRSAF